MAELRGALLTAVALLCAGCTGIPPSPHSTTGLADSPGPSTSLGAGIVSEDCAVHTYREDDFQDADGDGRVDTVNNGGMDKHVLWAFVDDDGDVDFVVDEDGNGRHSLCDTVVLSTFVQASFSFAPDMNGDGTEDLAVSLDGGGLPSSFIDGTCRKEACSAFPIVLDDVTGDGTDDWTYDHSGRNGRTDSYFDPVTGETGFIPRP